MNKIIPGLAFLAVLVSLSLLGCSEGSTPSPTIIPTQTIPPTSTLMPTPTQIPTSAVTPPPQVTPTPEIQQNPTEATQPTLTQIPDASAPTITVPQSDTNTSSETDLSNCTDTAGFFGDVTIPDGTSFKQNEPFVKTWRIRNEGTCIWNSDYVVIFSGGSQMSAPLTNPMPPAAPGDIIDISVNMIAPSSGGEFTGLWEFQNPNGQRFGVNSGGGGKIWLKIGVTIFNDQGQIVAIGSNPKPTPANEPATPTSSGCNLERNPDYEQQILQKVNTARSQNGLPALTLNDKLSAAAYSHSADMACKDFVDHAGSDGSTWYTRIKSQNYSYKHASENIYVGNPAFGGTADGAFNWWMNSQVHRDNILSTKSTEIGIGYAYNPNSSFGGYYTINFARP